MKEQILDEVVARRFLLGQLSSDEQGRIEELAFDNPESFELLQAAEDDLVDEFVYDDLTVEERERFQEYFLVQQPERRNDIRVANAIREYFEREQNVPSLWERFRSWFHFGATPLLPLVAKAVIIVGAAAIGLVILIPRIFRPGFDQPFQVQQRQPSAEPSPTSTRETSPQPSPSTERRDDQDKPPVPHRPSSPTFAVLLSPGGLTRSGDGGTEVIVKPGRLIDFKLPLTDDNSYGSYAATLEKDGQTIFTWSNRKPTKYGSVKVIRIRVDSSQLKPPETYRFTLNGVTSSGELKRVNVYYFSAH